MPNSKKIEWSGILGLIFSAIGGCAIFIAFAFTTFQTKSEAQIEANHTKTQEDNLEDNFHTLDSKLDNLRDKIDELLGRK